MKVHGAFGFDDLRARKASSSPGTPVAGGATAVVGEGGEGHLGPWGVCYSLRVSEGVSSEISGGGSIGFVLEMFIWLKISTERLDSEESRGS